MKAFIPKMIFLLILAFSSSFGLFAQSLPAGSAGIVYTYDAAGNRTKVEYIVNNTTSAIQAVNQIDTVALAKKLNEQVLKVNSLYPNPTTGQITVKLVAPLQNGLVQIMDVAGRILLTATANGSILNYDLSHFAAGVYFLHIEQGEQKITLKIIKR